MKAHYNHKRLNADEYLEWLNTYLSLLNDFTSLVEKDSCPETHATMISFLRVGEHVFSFFINHRVSVDMGEFDEIPVEANKDLAKPTYADLKIERDRLAKRIAGIIKSDPKTLKRFEGFCDNLKEPVTLGCIL